MSAVPHDQQRVGDTQDEDDRLHPPPDAFLRAVVEAEDGVADHQVAEDHDTHGHESVPEGQEHRDEGEDVAGRGGLEGEPGGVGVEGGVGHEEDVGGAVPDDDIMEPVVLLAADDDGGPDVDEDDEEEDGNVGPEDGQVPGLVDQLHAGWHQLEGEGTKAA